MSLTPPPPLHPTETAEDNAVALFFQLRIAVAALGEQEGWWTSRALDPARSIILKQLYPHTWRLAAMNAASDAARRVHERAVTNRAQHLFRVNTELEQDLRRMLSANADRAFCGQERFDETVADPIAALAVLAEKGVRCHEGAVSLGNGDRKNILRQVPRMAAFYLAAYRNGTQCFPFFEPEKCE